METSAPAQCASDRHPPSREPNPHDFSARRDRRLDDWA
jgi:hypothetical protein